MRRTPALSIQRSVIAVRLLASAVGSTPDRSADRRERSASVIGPPVRQIPPPQGEAEEHADEGDERRNHGEQQRGHVVTVRGNGERDQGDVGEQRESRPQPPPPAGVLGCPTWRPEPPRPTRPRSSGSETVVTSPRWVRDRGPAGLLQRPPVPRRRHDWTTAPARNARRMSIRVSAGVEQDGKNTLGGIQPRLRHRGRGVVLHVGSVTAFEVSSTTTTEAARSRSAAATDRATPRGGTPAPLSTIPQSISRNATSSARDWSARALTTWTRGVVAASTPVNSVPIWGRGQFRRHNPAAGPEMVCRRAVVIVTVLLRSMNMPRRGHRRVDRPPISQPRRYGAVAFLNAILTPAPERRDAALYAVKMCLIAVKDPSRQAAIWSRRDWLILC